VGNAAGATANRVRSRPAWRPATTAATSRTRHRDPHPRRKSSPELAAALETWRNIRFEYDSVDKLDEVAK